MSESTPAPRRSAIVTGASRGIGLGVATHLAATGWDLTLVARGADRLEQVRAQLAGSGTRVQAVPADMAEEDAVAGVVERHREAFGALSALVLGAGVGSAAPLEGYPMRRYDKQLAVNTRAPFQLISLVLPLLRAGAAADPARGSRVVALTSVEALYPEAGLSAYGASKAALLALVQSVNVEEGRNGVTATAVSPAYVDTEMSDWVSDRIPKESMISVDDVVKVVELVLSVSARAALPHIVLNRAGASPFSA